MKDFISHIKLYKELEDSLAYSTSEQRNKWATQIIENGQDLKDLSNLLFCDKKIASRFLCLLSDIGALDPNTLFVVLPYLLKLSEEVKQVNLIQSFASYWLLTGVPEEKEAQAIDFVVSMVVI